MKDTVVLHDGTLNPGGAVDVVVAMTEELDADFVIGFSGISEQDWEREVPNDARVLERRNSSSFLKDTLLVKDIIQLDLNEYDRVVTSGPVSKFYQPYNNQEHIHYIHHPPLDFLWYDGSLVKYPLKVLDRLETRSIPVLVANSEFTADRVETHYGRRPDRVINPPVDTEISQTDPESGKVVMVGRLEERKRPEIATEAFKLLRDRHEDPPELHLIGGGPMEAKLKARAPPNVYVHGYVDDEELERHLTSSDIGLFLAHEEDFGIAPVEYLSAGLPVVGVGEQNTVNQLDRETGVLVDPEPLAVAKGIETALGIDWDRDQIQSSAEKYSAERFRREIREL